MDSSQIKEVFEENYQWFKRFLRGRFISLNDFDIEDLIQQTALNLLTRGANVASIKSLTSYVYASLENGAKDLFKKHRRESLTADDPDGASASTEDEALLHEQKQALAKAVASLEENQRYVFVETEFKGRNYEDLAKETGEKVPTLLSRKSRAVKKLRTIMNGYMKEEQQ